MKGSWREFAVMSAIAAVVAVVLLFGLGSANLRIVTGIYMWIGLALSWNLIGGYCGYLSFGHSAFFGIGAYTAALAMTLLHLPFGVGMIMAAAAASLVALLIGVPTLRLSGAYFAIGTWAVALVLLQLSSVLDITGGTFGLSLSPVFGERTFNMIMFGLAWITFALVWRFVEHGRFGKKLEAIRENESAAEMLGINTTREKLVAFAASAALPALFGAVYGIWISFIDPQAVFGPKINDPMVLMAILGGLGTLFGPVAGAIILYALNRIIWINYGSSTAYLVILGVVTCVIVLYAPEGLASLVEPVRRRWLRYRRGARGDLGARD